MKTTIYFFLLYFLLISQDAAKVNVTDVQTKVASGSKEGSGKASGLAKLGEIGSSFRVEKKSGQLTAKIPLIRTANFQFNLNYSSVSVPNYTEKPNFLVPNGHVGIGFSLSNYYITANHNNTTDLDDDDYYLIDPSGARYELKLKSGSSTEYLTIPFSNLKITANKYTVPSTSTEIIRYWEIKDTNGNTFRFGDLVHNNSSISSANASRYVRAWNGTVMNGWNTTNITPVYMPYTWDIANVKDRFDRNILNFTYTQVQEDIHPYIGGSIANNTYTVNSYLSTVNNLISNELFTINWTDYNQSDQSFIELRQHKGSYRFYINKYIAQIKTSKNGIDLQTVVFNHDIADGVNSTQKRIRLNNIEFKGIVESARSNKVIFDYYTDLDTSNKHKDLENVLKSVSSGGKKSIFIFGKQTLNQSDIAKVFNNSVGSYNKVNERNIKIGNGFFIVQYSDNHYAGNNYYAFYPQLSYLYYYYDGQWKQQALGYISSGVAIHPERKSFVYSKRIGNGTDPNQRSRTVHEYYFEKGEWKQRDILDATNTSTSGLNINSPAPYNLPVVVKDNKKKDHVQLIYYGDILVVNWQLNHAADSYRYVLLEKKDDNWYYINNSYSGNDKKDGYHFAIGKRYIMVHRFTSTGVREYRHCFVKKTDGTWINGTIQTYGDAIPHGADNYVLFSITAGGGRAFSLYFDHLSTSNNVTDYFTRSQSFPDNPAGKYTRASQNSFLIHRDYNESHELMLYEYDGFSFTRNNDLKLDHVHENDSKGRAFIIGSDYLFYNQSAGSELRLNWWRRTDTGINYIATNSLLDQNFISTARVTLNSISPFSGSLSTFDKPSQFSTQIYPSHNFLIDAFENNISVNKFASSNTNNVYNVLMGFNNSGNQKYNFFGFDKKLYIRDYTRYKQNYSGLNRFDLKLTYSNVVDFYHNIVIMAGAGQDYLVVDYRNSLNNLDLETLSDYKINDYYAVTEVRVENLVSSAGTQVSTFYEYSNGKLSDDLQSAIFESTTTYLVDKSQGYQKTEFINTVVGGSGDTQLVNPNQYIFGQVKKETVFNGLNQKVAESEISYYLKSKPGDSYSTRQSSSIQKSYPKPGLNDFNEVRVTNTYDDVYEFVKETVKKTRIYSGTVEKALREEKSVLDYIVNESASSLKTYIVNKNLIKSVRKSSQYLKDGGAFKLISQGRTNYGEQNSHFFNISQSQWIDYNQDAVVNESTELLEGTKILSFNSSFLPVETKNPQSNIYSHIIYESSDGFKPLAKVNNAASASAFFYSMGDFKNNGNSLPPGINSYANTGNSSVKTISDFTRTGNGHSLYIQANTTSGSGNAGISLNDDFKDEFNSSDYIIEFDLYLESGAFEIYGSNGVNSFASETRTGEWLHKRHIVRKQGASGVTYLYFRNKGAGQSAKFYLDNIRVYPKTATMESFIYNPELKVQTAVMDKSGRISARSLNSNYQAVMQVNEKNEPAASVISFDGSYYLGTLAKYQSIQTNGLEPGHHENFNDQKAERFSVFSNQAEVSVDYSQKQMDFNVTASATSTSSTNYQTYSNPQSTTAGSEVTLFTITANSTYLNPNFTSIRLEAHADIYNYKLSGNVIIEYLSASGSVLLRNTNYNIYFEHSSNPPDIQPSPGPVDLLIEPVPRNANHTYTDAPAGTRSVRVKWKKNSVTGTQGSPNVISNAYIRAKGDFTYSSTIPEEIITFNDDIANQRISVEYDVMFSSNVQSGGFYYRGQKIDINPKHVKLQGSGSTYMQSAIAVNKWQHIKLVIEPVTTYSAKCYIWVNGDNAISSSDLYFSVSTGNSSLKQFGIYSPNDLGQMHIDNISIFKEPVYTTTFYNGAGNETQVQSWNGTSNIVSVKTYDSYFRLEKDYQAFPNTKAFKYVSNFDNAAKAYRSGSGNYPFLQFEYFNKPGAVVKKQSEIGHSISSRFSESKELVLAQAANVPAEIGALLTANYWKSESVDPDAVKSMSYTDIYGNVVATEIQSNKTGSPEKKFTVSEYDYLGRLTDSYTPNSNFAASNATFHDKYSYNGLNKVTKSELVNEGESKQIFDRLGRLRAKQLANYGGTKGYYWEIYKYDRFGRLLVEGLLQAGLSEVRLKTMIDNEPLFISQKAIHGADPRANYKDFLQVITYNQSQSPFNQPIHNDKVHVFNSSHSANDLIFNPGFETGDGVEMIAGHNVLNEVPASLKIKSIYFYDDYNFDLSSNSSQDLSGVTTEDEINAMGQVSREISYLSGSDYLVENYIYDEYGAVKEKRLTIPGLAEKNIVYKYDEGTRELEQVDYNPAGDGSDRIVMDYTYNKLGQLTNVESSDNGSTNKRTEITNLYDNFGRQSTISPNNTGNHSLHYKYDHLDRLKEINNFSLATSSVFSENIVYRTDGLIDYAEYQNKHFTGSGSGNSPIYKYSYSYNNFNELKAADYQYKASFAANYTNPTDFNTSYNFDKNGNMLSLNRRYASSADSWTYSYYVNTDKLKSLGGPDFTYDASGLLKYDPTRSVNLSYDHKNRLKSASGTAVNDQYFYDNQTRRVKTVNSITGTTTYYVYGLSANALAVYEGSNIKEWALGTFGTKHKTSSGRKSTYHFKDHKGNIRVSIDETGQTISARDYFPFGKVLRSYELAGNGKQRYKYSGKELDASTNYSYYGFRYYNADIARWMNPDPAHQFASPYLFNGNLPHIAIDKDGRFAFLLPVLAAMAEGALVGAAISTTVYTVGYVYNGMSNGGNYGQNFLGGFGKAALAGGISGAISGGIGEVAGGITQTIGAKGIIGNSLTHSLTNVGLAAASGERAENLWKHALQGFASGYVSSSGFFGLAKDREIIDKVSKKKSYLRSKYVFHSQILSTTFNSITENWAYGMDDPFSNFTFGIGPLTLRMNNGDLQLNFEDNIESTVFNGIGLISAIGSWSWDKESFGISSGVFYFKNSWEAKVRSFLGVGGRPVGPGTVFGISKESKRKNTFSEEVRHSLQARFMKSNTFLLNYLSESFRQIILGNDGYHDNFYEEQAKPSGAFYRTWW